MGSMDGYDKLKPFGFSIHGCIDAYVIELCVELHINFKRYSRRIIIIWLETCTTNDNPRIVTYYYLRAVE